MRIQKSLPFLFCFVALAACANPGPDEAGGDLSESELAQLDKADSLTGVPLPAGSEHLYFDTNQSVWLDATDVAPRRDLAYRYFTAQGGHQFKLGVAQLGSDGNVDPAGHPGFKLQRLARDSHGKLYWVVARSVDGVNGSAVTTYTGSVTRLYLVTATASPLPVELQIHLGCAGGDHSACAVAGQPGDACSRPSKCDSGEFCQAPEGACGNSGTCVVQPAVCPRLGLACFPVCGCNGNTYCRGCEVVNAGVSIAHSGTCDCDPTRWGAAAVSDASLAGNWTYINGWHITYTFDGAGRFLSVQEPACAYGNPRCLIKLAPHNGSYTIVGSEVHLSYDASPLPPPSAGTVVLSVQSNCQGAQRLVGTDYGMAITATKQ